MGRGLSFQGIKAYGWTRTAGGPPSDSVCEAWMKTVIVYEDEHILVCHKPAGLAVQSARASEMDMESELRNYLHGGALHVIHRLDQPVEGLLVFAKSRAMAAKLDAQMRDGRMRKYYRALVCGKMPQEEGVLIDEIVKKGSGIGAVVTKSAECPEGAKRAVLTYQVETYDDDTNVSNVKICLKTGRFHQIRLQFSHAGHPLVGDRKYGDENAKALANTMGITNVALCAEQLCFLHPETGNELAFCITPGFHKK